MCCHLQSNTISQLHETKLCKMNQDPCHMFRFHVCCHTHQHHERTQIFNAVVPQIQPDHCQMPAVGVQVFFVVSRCVHVQQVLIHCRISWKHLKMLQLIFFSLLINLQSTNCLVYEMLGNEKCLL